MTLAPGQRLSCYSILGELGSGAMGEVYRAQDTRLGRQVAIKVLPEHFADDEERLQRFEREARALAALNHPGVAQIFSVDQEGNCCFLVLELIAGETLEERLRRGPLPLAEALGVCAEIADAVAAAHAARIVHRDLKPANVRITPQGRVKVLDFGIAKTENEPVAGTDGYGALHTEVGRILGTPTYMAPEQARGLPVDGRVDVWSVGCILFECLSGSRAFEGGSLADVLVAVIERDPDWTKLPASTPPHVRSLLRRCLAKAREARPAEIGELRTLLARPTTSDGYAVGARAALSKPPPPAPTPLLGREAHLDHALERVRDGARLLTITGYGGTGKTRFASELYNRLAPEHPGGAAFVSLAAVTQAEAVLPTVGIVLDIAEAHGRSALDALSTVIAGGRVLLVLDNLEQVLDAAEDIAALVARCPALQVIATSRAPLKVGAETEFALPPLALPDADAVDPDTLGRFPSIALFVQRVRKVRPGFALDASNATAVAAICRRLDGLPLALELAAARVRILEPAALLARLDHALDLLTSGDRDLPIRQRTLRATISWSYSLLGQQEQRTLRRLSVFHDGWTLEAMERVCFADVERAHALDELDSLVEKGLVRVVGQGERYTLLETVRAFAAEQLHAGGEVNAIRQAHATHFLEFAAGVSAGILGTGQRAAVLRALADNANTLAAIRWFLAAARAGDASALEQALLLCGYLDWFWHIRGLHFTARVLLDELLALSKDLPPSRGRALARLAAGMVSTTTGEWERSLAEWSAGHADGLAINDAAVVTEGAMGMGYCCLSLGRMQDARAALDESIAGAANGVSDFMLALSMAIKGMLLFVTGDLDAGLALERDARRIQNRIADHEGGGIAQSFLAQMTFAKGDHAGALSLYREALEQFELIGDRPEIARVHCEMGWTALAGADAGAARASFRRAVLMYQEVGSPRGTGLALLGLAASAAAEGRSERAVTLATAARSLAERAGVVVTHPMDPGVLERIQALEASIPEATLDGLRQEASALSPADVLALIDAGELRP